MTREEAIKHIKAMCQMLLGADNKPISDTYYALEVALEELSDEPCEDAIRRWIPVSDRLPDNDDMMLVTCRTKKGVSSVNRAYYSRGSWHGSGSMSGVIAWMPMPEPYSGEAER